MNYKIVKLDRPRVNKCESCDRFDECFVLGVGMKNLCDGEGKGDVYYIIEEEK